MSGVKVTGTAGKWVVKCSRCQTGLDGVVDMWKGLLGPHVVTAHGWQDAMWWARWHVAEHDRTRCGECERDRHVDRVEALDPEVVKVGKRYFFRDGAGWTERAETA